MEAKGKLNGISLFTGYAGIDLALSEYVRPVVYCEIERYPQAILLSRMDDGSIPFAPIWNDVTTLNGNDFKGLVDIVYGGFPCQDISVAGKGAGLAGKRSGLFSEIIRLCKEASPQFIFLENVPAIRTRGAIEVQEALASIGYDSRWCTLSAAEVGANHKRERWFCLAANTNSELIRNESGGSKSNWKNSPITGNNGEKRYVANTKSSNDRLSFSGESEGQVQQPGISLVETNMADPRGERLEGQRESSRVQKEQSSPDSIGDAVTEDVANPNMQRRGREANAGSKENNERIGESNGWPVPSPFDCSWWQAEPGVGRVANGVKDRAHRIKALGNGVVPLQVKTAFEILMGIQR